MNKPYQIIKYISLIVFFIFFYFIYRSWASSSISAYVIPMIAGSSAIIVYSGYHEFIKELKARKFISYLSIGLYTFFFYGFYMPIIYIMNENVLAIYKDNYGHYYSL